MPNALDVFREQQKAAGLVYERVRQVAELLAAVRQQVDGLLRNDELRNLLKNERQWIADAERLVSQVRALREQEIARYWPAMWRRWAIAAAFALASAWAAGAGYAWLMSPAAAELATLRSRIEAVDSFEQRVATMTPAERKQFDKLMAREREGTATHHVK
jgi:hypothetical protein